MSRYEFNMRLGHYVLNEDATTETPADDKSADVNAAPKAALKNLETEEVLTLKKNLQNKSVNMDRTIQQKKDVVLQMEQKISKELESGTAQQKTINDLQSSMLQATVDLLKIQFDKAKMEYDENLKIIQKQSQELKVNESRCMIPEKYRRIDESEIQDSKIHIDTLIKNDPQMRVRSIADFKRMFEGSDLLYGKDREGYFAICVDDDDLGRLTETLEASGFMRDEIIAHVMPQIFEETEED